MADVGIFRPHVTYRLATSADLSSVKQLHSVLLPVAYPDNFFAKLACCIVAVANDMVTGRSELIGVVSSRTTDENLGSGVDSRQFLHAPSYQYVATLGVLAKYRGQGVGSKLLQHLLLRLVTPSMNYRPDIILHMLVDNDQALRLYQRHAFRIVGRAQQHYYIDNQLRDAWVLKADPDEAATIAAQMLHGESEGNAMVSMSKPSSNKPLSKSKSQFSPWMMKQSPQNLAVAGSCHQTWLSNVPGGAIVPSEVKCHPVVAAETARIPMPLPIPTQIFGQPQRQVPIFSISPGWPGYGLRPAPPR